MRVAYHEWRQPLLINSNWWLLLQDDPTVPQRIRDSVPSLGSTVTKWQIRRAAWLIIRFLDYRDKLESFVLVLFDPLTLLMMLIVRRYTLIHHALVRSPCRNTTGLGVPLFDRNIS